MDNPDGLELTERLVTPAEMAQIMGVDEAEVLAWIESGDLEVKRGEGNRRGRRGAGANP